MIKRLPSVDLEILYLITRYPEWHPQDVISLDEAFRGEKTSVRAMDRRNRRLKEKQQVFVNMSLLQDDTDRYMLAGDEFLQLYLRFFYEVRKYGNLAKQINLGEGPATPFGEKAEKLIRSLAWEVERRPSVVQLTLIEADAERADVISEVRHRCAVLESVLRGEPTEPGAKLATVLESLTLCQLISKHAQYYLLVVAVRNLENPRESLLVEMYFETGEPLVFPLTLLTEQAEAAGILVEAFDSWFVELPTLEEFVKGVSGHTLDELIAHSGAVEQWMVRSIRKLVEEEKPPKTETQEENEEDETSDWIELYRKQKYSDAVKAITTQLGDNPRRTVAARLQNDRGYIRYEIEGQAEYAKHDLERAVALHHSQLAITLLNLSVIAIDNRDYAQAIEKIEDALLITHGRESVNAAYLRLRLLPSHLQILARREKWEQHPANVLEAAYVNMAYASAQQSGYDAAREVLEESLELMPTSVYLRHALARLHLWKKQAGLADALYLEMAEMPIADTGLISEIKSYWKLRRLSRKK
jgi:tetratricopeptide (TPR) repeat protein